MNANAAWIVAIIAVIAVIGLAVMASGSESNAKSNSFDQATAGTVREATGTVFDWTTPADWIVSGIWALECNVPCASAALSDIKFDLAHVMVQEGGGASHAHSYKDFTASSVAAEGGNLVIEGTITGSGPISTTPIKIKLTGVSGAGIFAFELPGNQHLMGEIGGVIVESED